jgi:hypothetical protein
MILLQMGLQGASGPVHDPVPDDLPNGAWVGVVAIGGDPGGRHAGHGPGRAAAGLGCRAVPGLAEPCVKHGASSVNRTVEGPPLSLDFAVRCSHIPALAHGTRAPPAQGLAAEWSPLALPLPHRVMGEEEATRETHCHEGPQAQCIAAAPPDNQAHHSRRRLETMAQRPCAVMKATAAVTTADTKISEVGALRAFGGRGGLTGWAWHTPPPLRRRSVPALP